MSQRNWEEAQQFCSSNDAKVVEIDSFEENTALVEEMEKRGFVQRKMSFWLGLTDKVSEGSFVLESTGLAPSFTNWATNEPNNLNGTEDCSEIIAGSWGENTTHGKWNDNSCSLNMSTICEGKLLSMIYNTTNTKYNYSCWSIRSHKWTCSNFDC